MISPFCLSLTVKFSVEPGSRATLRRGNWGGAKGRRGSEARFQISQRRYDGEAAPVVPASSSVEVEKSVLITWYMGSAVLQWLLSMVRMLFKHQQQLFYI